MRNHIQELWEGSFDLSTSYTSFTVISQEEATRKYDNEQSHFPLRGGQVERTREHAETWRVRNEPLV